MTPARFVSSVRLETARRLLEETSEPLEVVCAMSGLGTAESMRRVFLRGVGVPPGQYRERFNHSPQSAKPPSGASQHRRPS
jgi:transcriptional regulator GlxA family with amidase domain